MEICESQTKTRSGILTNVQQLAILAVGTKYHDSTRKMLGSFADMLIGTLERINAVRHHIGLMKNSRLFRFALYRAPSKTCKLKGLEIHKQLKADVVKPATSEWASQVFFVPKKSESFRFCIDYHCLNEAAPKGAYPLLRIDECTDPLDAATIFSTLVANSDYEQISVVEEDRDRTAFVRHTGLLRYKRMSFRITNAPATFQIALDVI